MFTPIETTIGAILLHQATSLLLFNNGSVLGASGMLRGFLTSPSKPTAFFFTGMALSFLPLKTFLPDLLPSYTPLPLNLQSFLTTFGVGALVGWGTKGCNGCTSGHMLCGLSRLSGRSIVAVMTFLTTAIVTNHIVHPSLETPVCSTAVPCYKPIYPSSATTSTLLLLTVVVVTLAQVLPRLLESGTASEPKRDNIGREVTRFLSGLEFGLGLHITGMSQSAKLRAFFAFPNIDAWDPSLLLVLAFGVVPNLLEIKARGFNKAPAFNERFELPRKAISDIDWRFILGAVVFGIGWGMEGTCPGPAILRSVMDPIWGILWMSGFWIGGKVL